MFILFHLFFFLLLAGAHFSDGNELGAVPENVTAVPEMMMVPLIEPEKGEIFRLVLNETRRKLGGFKICSLCTCCAAGGGGGGGGRGYCLPSPCCYAINCNIPNRPFGVCSFTPKTCNCFGCHL
ncbi:hypothetical protein QVD17_07985 [Tagetes erecta]|uniref:DUF7866 domain-containing protein n=1 Tax=Tagetes erecta TaxID=13708 RepID=A0AAD8KXK9_TARER|nr:hypothetical protein QVD17_07985 [Tagetes erecta]